MGKKPTKITQKWAFWHKNHIFRGLKSRGAIKTGGWVGFRDEEWTSRYEYAKMDSFEIEQTTKLDLRYEYLTVKQRHEQARRRTTPDDNDENKIASDIKRQQTTSTRSERTRSVSPRPSRGRTLLQGSTETLLQYTMRPSIIHPNQCIYDVKTGSEFLQYRKNCAS